MTDLYQQSSLVASIHFCVDLDWFPDYKAKTAAGPKDAVHAMSACKTHTQYLLALGAKAILATSQATRQAGSQ